MGTRMKKAIFTIAIGNDPMYQAAIRSFKRYASKVGADLIISDQSHYKHELGELVSSPSVVAFMEKLYIGEVLKQYDRVLYLDADIIITDTARDIFQLYSDPKLLYALDEGSLIARDDEFNCLFNLFGALPKNPAIKNGLYYFNVGVILVSKHHPLFNVAKVSELKQVMGKVLLPEQAYLSYLINKHHLPIHFFEPGFNYIELFGAGDNPKRFQADFIHYAGKGFARRRRYRILRYARDYTKLFFATESKLYLCQLWVTSVSRCLKASICERFRIWIRSIKKRFNI